MDIIVGTAGHIDHGKTALVKALTGIDADRLPEEKQRGITIDLGFAELDLGGVHIGFVDVPGHERFVKNMLAGAYGIDIVLLVVAADEGVMPQTREHFNICRLLEIKTGLIVLTKKDLVDEELLELVKLDVQELVENSFLENAPVIAVSAKSGEGVNELKESLKEIALQIPARRNEKIARLPIDRAFTVKGFGAVVTGTLVAGDIAVGEEMQILPFKRKVRIRGIQTHGKTVENAYAGQRTAVNLGGIDHTEIERGQTLATLESMRPTQIFDAQIEVLKDAAKSLKSRQRVRVHIGTIEALARLQVINQAGEILPGEKGLVQIRLEIPVSVLPDERFILRSYSPSITIAGGKILDGLAQKHRRKDFETVGNRLSKLDEALSRDDKQTQVKTYLEIAGEFGLSFADLRARSGWVDSILKEVLQKVLEQKSVIQADEIYIQRTAFENLTAKTVAAIQAHHKSEPLSRGMLQATLREKVFAKLPAEIFKKILQVLIERGEVAVEKDIIRASSYSRSLSANDAQILEKLQNIYQAAKLEIPSRETALDEAIVGTKTTREQAQKIFQILLDSGELIKVTEDFYFNRDEIGNLIKQLKDFADKSSDRLIDVAAFKDIAGISRKYAIPLLEYFDREKIMRRAGDKRLIL